MKLQKEWIKETFRLFLNQMSPKIYYKWLESRYSVVNNMNVYLLEDYDSRGTFATMWDIPPHNYTKWKNSRTYNAEEMPIHAPDGSNKASAVPIIQYGICEYAYYIHTKDKEHFDIAKKVADWLVRHQADNGGWLYEYDYYHPRVNKTIKAPWICGMAQGEAIGFLSRMYKLCNDERYKYVAEKAMQPLTIDVDHGGVQRKICGGAFYEEYPTEIPSYTLNGFMYCLVGLYDGYVLCGFEEAKKLFDNGYQTLLKILPLYDSEHTSYYDLSHITNPPRKPQWGTKYDPLHVMLLQTLNLIKPHEIIRFYVEKWSWGVVKAENLKC